MALHPIANTTLATQMHQESTNKCIFIHRQNTYTEGTPTTKIHQIPVKTCSLCSSSRKEKDEKLELLPMPIRNVLTTLINFHF
jgi:hypothetical protein